MVGGVDGVCTCVCGFHLLRLWMHWQGLGLNVPIVGKPGETMTLSVRLLRSST